MRLTEITGIPPESKLLNRPSSLLSLPETLVGIEIEWEGLDLHECSDYVRENEGNYWGVKRDGSLRNGGIELVLKRPVFGEDLLQALSVVDSLAKVFNPELSDRCSVHVHVDVRDLTLQEVYKILFLYLVLERSMVKFHGRKRERNIFCLPYYVAPGNLDQLGYVQGEDLHSAMGLERARSILQGSCEKYSAFNLAALFAFGSIEFRHMGGSDSSEEILQWVNVCLALKKEALAIDLPIEKFLKWYRQQDMLALVGRVFGDSFVEEHTSMEILKDCHKGLLLVRRLLVKPAVAKKRNTSLRQTPSSRAVKFLQTKATE